VNWTEILAAAGIPEPPGRQEAIDDTLRKVEQRNALNGGHPKRKKGSNKRQVTQVSRKTLQARERAARNA
jgi:hypothetical protein